MTKAILFDHNLCWESIDLDDNPPAWVDDPGAYDEFRLDVVSRWNAEAEYYLRVPRSLKRPPNGPSISLDDGRAVAGPFVIVELIKPWQYGSITSSATDDLSWAGWVNRRKIP